MTKQSGGPQGLTQSSRRNRFGVWLILCAFLAAAPASALGCGDGAVQFADDFVHPGKEGRYGDTTFLQTGKLLQTAQPTQTSFNVFQLTSYSQADVCVNVTAGDYSAAEQLTGGILFWGTGARSENHYVFQILPAGTWWLGRRLDGAWSIIERGQSPFIKTGGDATNEVELRIDGDEVHGLINGAEVVGTTIPSPLGGGTLGIISGSENTRANIWTFQNFRVLELPTRN